MRIISGERRGMRLISPRGDRTRPTSDMVREAIFNILDAEVEDRVVYDLFAGTGALGLEALSRGAARAVFVESNRGAVEALKQNIGHLRYEDRAQVVALDAHRWVRFLDQAGGDDAPALVFLDPPYREFENHPDRMRRLFRELNRRLGGGTLLVVESGSALEEGFWPEGAVADARRYGSTHVTILTMPRGSGEEVEAEVEVEGEEAEVQGGGSTGTAVSEEGDCL